jgi:hypothetical protein
MNWFDRSPRNRQFSLSLCWIRGIDLILIVRRQEAKAAQIRARDGVKWWQVWRVATLPDD